MAHEVQAWKGAVEPTAVAPSGNQVALWKGAIEPGAFAELLADDVESASEVSVPAIAGTHILLATSIESASELTSPSAAGTINFTPVSVESVSEVSTPVFSILYVRKLIKLTGKYND